MYIVIAGCGRVGARLATDMAADGHNVVVIDRNRAAFTNLGPAFNGVALLGTAIDEDVLRQAGIERADAFAATTSYDNVNIMAVQMAHEVFGVARVASRVLDPGRLSLFEELGLNPVCATNLAAQELYAAVASEGFRHRQSIGAGQVAELEVFIDADHADLGLADLESDGQCRVYAVIREGRASIPGKAYRTRKGDRLLVSAQKSALRALARQLGRKA